MKFNQSSDMTDGMCRNMRTLLSDYIDNALSARQTLDLEKHLSICPPCAAQARQMQLMVGLVRMTPHCDTGDDFMAKLHTRLDSLEPELSRHRSLAAQLGDWATGVQDQLRARSLPGANMALALSCVAALLILPLLPQNSPAPEGSTGEVARSISQPVQKELDRHIADVAGDPLGDVAAAKLTAHLNPGDDTNGSEEE